MGGCIKTTGLIFLVLVAALLIYGTVIEPYRLDEADETAAIPGLPPTWEGRRIAVLSDFQVGMWGDNYSTVVDAVEEAVEGDPAVLLLLGDYVYHPVEDPAEEMERVVEALEPLKTVDFPVFGLLANHDYAVAGKEETPSLESAENVVQGLESVGVIVLRNEAAALVPGDPPVLIREGSEDDGFQGEDVLYLVGLDSYLAGLSRPEAAFSQVPDPAPRFVALHHPESFCNLPAGAAPVAVGGHTHGGQIAVPFMPEWSWISLVEEGEAYADGWIDGCGEPGNHLYVNRGIGFSIIPVRMNASPELTWFTLTGEE